MTEVKRGGFASYSLEYVALGLLMAGPKHGYGLYQDFTHAFDLIWNAEQAKFYVVLAASEEKGYLEVTTEPQEKRPARKVYHITEAGRKAFLHWLRQPVTSMRAVRVEFIAKLRFYNILKLDGAVQLIDAQIAALQSMLGEWERSPNGQQPDKCDPFHRLVDDFRRRQARFIIEWLAACKESAGDNLFIA